MIQTNDLWKRYGKTEILRGVSLEVSRGEVAAIIGPSGGGKSTFLRCLNGLESFDGGSVTIDGETIDARVPQARRREANRRICQKIGMVFQAFHLFAHWNVLRNVAEPPIRVLGLPRPEAEERARRLLDRVGMGDRLTAAPSELSGGQQQRVAIARALAMRPQAILFDEPTSALDPRMTGEVLSVMADLARDGQTMIVVTHAIGFARRVAHTVHVFDKGRVVESGPPDRVLENPAEQATRDLLAEQG